MVGPLSVCQDAFAGGSLTDLLVPSVQACVHRLPFVDGKFLKTELGRDRTDSWSQGDMPCYAFWQGRGVPRADLTAV